MRHKNLKRRAKPLNLGEAFVAFGTLRTERPEYEATAKLGMRLIREMQHLHRFVSEMRETLPDTYDGYIDPQRADIVLARTIVNSKELSA